MKEHSKNISSELKAIDCEQSAVGLGYIEEYLKKHTGGEFSLSYSTKTFEGFGYWARFEEPDDEDEDYKHFVQAEGKSMEEVVIKIATYIKSGKTYNDGRYI